MRARRSRCLGGGGRGCAEHALSRPGHWSSTVSTGAFFLMYSSSNSLAHAPFLPATTTRERRAARRWARGTGTTRETGRAAIADAIFARVCVIAPAPSLATWPRLERFQRTQNKSEARRAPTTRRRVAARHAPLGGPTRPAQTRGGRSDGRSARLALVGMRVSHLDDDGIPPGALTRAVRLSPRALRLVHP
jgi:hypothetical protein